MILKKKTTVTLWKKIQISVQVTGLCNNIIKLSEELSAEMSFLISAQFEDMFQIAL